MISFNQIMVEASKKQSNFTVNLSDARYVKPLLQQLIVEKGWKETISKDKFSMKWYQSKVEDEELIQCLSGKNQMANRFPGIYGMAHKDYYSRIMKMGRMIDEKVMGFEPEQFLFPQDQEMFKEHHKLNKEKGVIYIAKPVASSEGNSILLFKELNELPSMLSAEMIVQRYIHNPLLVDGYKFDLRVYVVIMGTDPISAFVCDEGLARFCTEKYEQPTKENFKQFFMHLTNYSINKHSEDFKESDNILGINNATKRTITSLMLSLKAQGVDVEKLRRNINKASINALSVYAPLIEHGVSVATNCKPLEGKFFQILGFDILPDENLDCYLLEINDHPSLDIYLEKDYMGGGGLKTLSQIDLYVKKRVLEDTIMLAKKSREDILQKETYKSLVRILPFGSGSEGAAAVYQTLNMARSLYYKVAPIKSKQTITSSNFEKLYTQSQYISGLQIKTCEMSLIFQKVSKAQKMIDFITFFWVLVALKKEMQAKADYLNGDRTAYAHLYQDNLLDWMHSEFTRYD